MFRSRPTVISQSAANLWRVLLLVACGCGGFVVGCNGTSPSATNSPAAASHGEHEHGEAAEHGHGEHDAPASYAEAVEQLEALRNTMRDAFAKNDAEAAHGPLHDVGHLLESMPALADKAGLDETQKSSVKAATELLFGYFGKVDEMMHGEEGTKYEDIASKIDEAVTTLRGLAPSK